MAVTEAGSVTGRAIVAKAPGGPEVLELVKDYSVASPKTGEILVKLASTGINNLECLVRSGLKHFRAAEYPCVLGSDGAGVVHAAAEGSKFKPGDKVVFFSANGIPKKGSHGATYAEYCLIPEACAATFTAEAERSLPLADAGGLPVAALAALTALDKLPGVQTPGKRLLIIGASGGVGQFAVQLARARGLHVVGVCGARNAEAVLALGAAEVFDYALGPEALRERFGGEEATKFDGLLDFAGGALPWAAAATVLKRSGSVSLLMTDATVLRSLAYYYLAGLVWLGPPTAVTVLTNDGCGPKLDRLVGLVAEGKLRMPKVSARFKPEEAAKAHELVQSHHVGGKVVIVW